MTSRTPRATRPAFAVAGIAIAMLALTACGGSSSTSSGTTTEPAATTSAAPQAGGDTTTDGQNAGPGSDFREAIETYRTCLADNGVTLPEFDGAGGNGDGTPPSGMPTGAPPSGFPTDGQGGPAAGGFPGGLLMQKPDDVDQSTWDAAVSACADVAPSFQPGQGGPGGGQPDETALAAFKNCLTENGVTVPDGDNWLRELDRNDATVAAAFEKCSPLLPQQGGGAGSATVSPGSGG